MLILTQEQKEQIRTMASSALAAGLRGFVFIMFYSDNCSYSNEIMGLSEPHNQNGPGLYDLVSLSNLT